MPQQHPLELLPLPEEFDYLKAAEKVVMDIENPRTLESVDQGLRTQLELYSDGALDLYIRRTERLGELFDPLPRATGVSVEHSPVIATFRAGALAGAAIARYVHAGSVPFSALGRRQTPDSIDDISISDEAKQEINLMDASDEGLQLMGESSRAVLKNLAFQAISRQYPLLQTTFVRGCGSIVYDAYHYHRSYQVPPIARILNGIHRKDDPLDWDEAFRTEFSNPE